MPAFSARSLERLAGCDVRLQQLFLEVVKHVDCTVLQGKRTEAEAAQNRADGTSHTNHSLHVYPLGAPSLAIDVAPYPVEWPDPKAQGRAYVKKLAEWYRFNGFVLGIAAQMGIPLRTGCDWDRDWDVEDQTFDDLPHYELRA